MKKLDNLTAVIVAFMVVGLAVVTAAMQLGDGRLGGRWLAALGVVLVTTCVGGFFAAGRTGEGVWSEEVNPRTIKGVRTAIYGLWLFLVGSALLLMLPIAYGRGALIFLEVIALIGFAALAGLFAPRFTRLGRLETSAICWTIALVIAFGMLRAHDAAIG